MSSDRNMSELYSRDNDKCLHSIPEGNDNVNDPKQGNKDDFFGNDPEQGNEDDIFGSNYDENHDDEGDIVENNLTFVNADISMDPTEDNLNLDAGFLTTQARDDHVSIEHNPNMDCISGHVLYNQAAVCTRRYGKRITGSQAQQHFIQRFCATTSGQACPLLSLEPSLYPRVFWKSAASDWLAVLGALSTWIYSTKPNVYSFASIYDINCTRITMSGALMSTCPHYHRFQFDVLGNIALSKGDWRDFINRGFQVDEKSSIGLPACNSSKNGLTQCVDSFEMVRGLPTSQEYLQFLWFLTFTCNHSRTPGVEFLHNWKRSGEWKSHVPYFHDMSEGEQNEYVRALEE